MTLEYPFDGPSAELSAAENTSGDSLDREIRDYDQHRWNNTVHGILHRSNTSAHSNNFGDSLDRVMGRRS